MTSSSGDDPELDSLIAEITVDCYNEDEALMAFQNAFEEDARLPCPGTVVGESVEVRWIGVGNGRRELIATCRRAGRDYDVALLDIGLQADSTTSRIFNAYRRWVGD
jgi:hypothetical protein